MVVAVVVNSEGHREVLGFDVITTEYRAGWLAFLRGLVGPGPRVRAVDGTGEVPVPAYDLFASTDLLDGMAMERMLAKLSCRRYRLGLEPVGAAVEAAAKSTSKSAVSRRFVRATEKALGELMDADLSGLDLVATMIDGVHFAGHCCVVALGIGIDGVKHPLAVEEGDTDNATVVRDLLTGLRDRGLDTTRPMLFVLDGAKALAAGVKSVFDQPVIQRCHVHAAQRHFSLSTGRDGPTRRPHRPHPSAGRGGK